VRPEAIEAMNELGIDLRRPRSKHVDEFAGQHFDLVITVCDHAKDLCPVFPESTEMLHSGFEDPVVGDVESFKRIRDQIAARFDVWLKG